MLTSMFDTTIKAEDLQGFKAHLHSELVLPGADGYESARRVWNGMIDKHPALIVRCADVSDVISAVHFARRQNLTVAVRGGGRSLAGHGVCDDGLVIDLSPMKGIQVDPQQRMARAEPGLTNAEFLQATQ